MNSPKTNEIVAINAQAELHHQFLLGLQLTVSMREGAAVVGDWMFRLFRRQHEEKFLSSFKKLGLDGLPDAVACARYHVLSNSIGGVNVEYMEESNSKAWVRFRYPRWMFDGPTICGIPVEASRGFLKGWYAQNGVSLGNPRLGFVCVSEDMTAQFGLCGYFKEFDHILSDAERLQFAPDELPPAFDPASQPSLPDTGWQADRLAKANRNYAMEYIRNGIRELTVVIGRDKARELACHAARLTGLQFYNTMASAVNARDGDLVDAANFFKAMLQGMGDEVDMDIQPETVSLKMPALRILRGLPADEQDTLLDCWIELWRGALNSHRHFMTLETSISNGAYLWQLKNRT